MDKFSEIFRIDSSRLQNWDYSWKGMYFVTICTKFHEKYFGEIKEGIMYNSEIGLEVQRQWLKTVELRPDMNLILEDFQVMPNHFHAIIGIGNNEFNKRFAFDVQCRDALQCVSTLNHALDYASSRNEGFSKNKFGPQRKNLASIMRGFKGSVTTFTRINKILFDWQPRFHDHIISNENELIKIKKYIQNNVRNWDKDRFYK